MATPGPPPPPPPKAASDAYRAAPAPPNQQPAAQHLQSPPPAPDESYVPAILHDKSKADLEELLRSPELQSALVYAPATAHPSVPASQAALRRLLDENVAVAGAVQGLEARLGQVRGDVSAHMLAVRGLEQQWRKKQAEMEGRLEGFGPRVLHQRLGAGIAEQEGVCRSLEESFLEGGDLATEREVGEWVRRVREARKVGYLRRERKARWDEGRVGGWR